MANYGPEADYQPHESDARECFQNQLKATDKAARHVKDTLNIMTDAARNDPSLNAKESEAFHKLEHLKATTSVYVSVKKMLEVKDIAMADKFNGLVDCEEDEKASLVNVYTKMTALLTTFEVRMYQIVDAPDGWFKMQFVKMKTWLEDNPKKATAGALACGAVGGAAAGAYACAHGHCIIYYLIHGCSCASWGVGASMAAGAGLGLLVGGLLVLCSIAVYNRCYVDRSENTQTDMEKINAMVDKLQTLPDHDFYDALGEIIGLCEQVLPASIPEPADRKCVICLSEGHEVETPVKAPRCRGPHFMCKACFIQNLAIRGDKCCVCRV